VPIAKWKKAWPLTVFLLSINVLFPSGSSGGASDYTVAPAKGWSGTTMEVRRRVYAPSFPDTIEWGEAGIFWFGRVDPPGSPGQNYADVRVAYTDEELVFYANVEDYYIWYDTGATSSSDLTQYDAVAIYLDTNYDQATMPQTEDYIFLSGLCLYGCGDGSSYRREARGTGAGWDFTWQGDWADGKWASWFVNPGFNDNQWDYGWWSYVHIPWTTLGLSGPPLQGTVWGLGIQLHDRDAASSGLLPIEYWPETCEENSPSTWGELAFGLADYAPVPAVAQGTTFVRRGLGDSVVEDAWVGGGGNCTGGHEGDPEHDNYGDDTGLYVENQSLIADFTCFSKSYLRFTMDDIPPGKTIISATLTLHHWGNADPANAEPSLIWLFTVDGDWEEYTLTWNNAPLARENLTTTWVNVLTGFPGWPGVAYNWDATQAVAEAHSAGEPLNVALYTSDTNFHSSKYLTSSDTGDWNAEGRPTLTIVWGEVLATVSKEVWPTTPSSGQVVTYTLSLLGSGQAITLTDDLPAEVGVPGPIQVQGGAAATYDPGAHRVSWNGSPDIGQPVTITFPVTIPVGGPLAISNTAVLTDAEGLVSTDTVMFIVDACRLWLPVLLRSE